MTTTGDAKAWKLGGQLLPSERKQMTNLLDLQKGNFAFSEENLGGFKGEPMEVPLTTEKAIFNHAQKLGKTEWEFVGANCDKLAKQGLIRPSYQSKYASFSEHLQHLEIVFNRLKSMGLKVHLEKCLFGGAEIDFLGHKVTAFGIQQHTEKTATIMTMTAPTDVSGLRALLGVFSCYRKFIPHFIRVALPLNALLRKDSTWR